MQKTSVQRPEIKLVGLSARTNNRSELDPMRAKIAPLVQRYFFQQTPLKIPGRKKTGTTFSAYTSYESDVSGDYTYFIGEEVESLDNVPEGFDVLLIPPQLYIKFTTEPGIMPGVVIEAWHKIWQFSPQELGGERGYQTDFELYDERVANPQRAVLDIYIGIVE